MNLTAATIEALPNPKSGQKIYLDETLKGFGVRVTAGSKTYVCERMVKGKNRRVSIGPFQSMTVAQARKHALKEIGAMAVGVDPNSKKAEAKAKSLTFQAAVAMYLKDRKHKTSTAKHIANCVDWYLGDWRERQIKDITPAAVVARFDKLTKNHGESVANVVFRYVRAIYNHALAATKTNQGVATLPANPVSRLSDLKRWHKPKARKGHITDFAEFLAAIEIASLTNSNRHPHAGADFSDFVELLLRMGLRKAEASNLQWGDVDLTAKTLTITAERAKNGNALTLPLPTQIVAVLERLSERYAGAQYVWGATPLGDTRKTLEKAREALGHSFNFHDLRRSFAIQAERAGVPFAGIKRMLNHATGSDVTIGHYLTSEDPEDLRGHFQKINDQIDCLAAGEKEK